MKYIKTYEITDKIESQLILPKFNDLVYLSIPSENYFKSSIKFTLIFIDNVYKNTYEHGKIEYVVKGDGFQRSEDSSGYDYYSIINWDQTYSDYSFKKIEFMTSEEFYEKYSDSFIKILEIMLEKLDNGNLTDFAVKIYNKIVDKLTIPETEHIVNAKKYNL